MTYKSKMMGGGGWWSKDNHDWITMCPVQVLCVSGVFWDPLFFCNETIIGSMCVCVCVCMCVRTPCWGWINTRIVNECKSYEKKREKRGKWFGFCALCGCLCVCLHICQCMCVGAWEHKLPHKQSDCERAAKLGTIAGVLDNMGVGLRF